MSIFLYLALAAGYLFIAAAAHGLQTQQHSPRLWTLRMNPIQEAHVGDILSVKVGEAEDDTRLFRVISVSGKTCMCIDKTDECQRAMVKAAWAFMWPLMLLGMVIGILHSMFHHAPKMAVAPAKDEAEKRKLVHH